MSFHMLFFRDRDLVSQDRIETNEKVGKTFALFPEVACCLFRCILTWLLLLFYVVQFKTWLTLCLVDWLCFKGLLRVCPHTYTHTLPIQHCHILKRQCLRSWFRLWCTTEQTRRAGSSFLRIFVRSRAREPQCSIPTCVSDRRRNSAS